MVFSIRKVVLGVAIAATCVGLGTGLGFAAPGSTLNAANVAFEQGHADDALRGVSASLQENANNASAWNLQCRIYLAQSRWQNAIPSCEKAVQLAPANSEYHRWLAHAYGEKASHAKLLSAYQTAKLAHVEFEKAVELDGHNREALSDLGEYYVQAPRVLGGGYDKADAMAARLDSLDPARAEELRALIAEAKKDYSAAEQDWRARISSSKSAESLSQAWMDLGSYYRRRGNFDAMLAALKNGAAADKDHGAALVDGASTLIAANREPTLAALWLHEYLAGDHLTATAPAFVVHAELGDLLKKEGNGPEANREFAAARALSADFVETATINTGD